MAACSPRWFVGSTSGCQRKVSLSLWWRLGCFWQTRLLPTVTPAAIPRFAPLLESVLGPGAGGPLVPGKPAEGVLLLLLLLRRGAQEGRTALGRRGFLLGPGSPGKVDPDLLLRGSGLRGGRLRRAGTEKDRQQEPRAERPHGNRNGRRARRFRSTTFPAPS